MADNQRFVSYMTQHGKQPSESWEDLAKRFHFNSAEAARTSWRRNRNKISNIAKEQETHSYIKDLEDHITSKNEDIKEGKAEITADVKEEIKTLEQLIDKCQIDTKIWNIDKYVQNYWGNSNTPHWQVKAYLSRRKVDTDLQLQKEVILEELRKESPVVPNILREWELEAIKKGIVFVEDNKKHLLEISLPDLHIGKLAWGEESGADYDITIAVQRFKDAVNELLTRVNLDNVERIHLPLGNDAIHVDNADNTTTKGTPVDTDGRFPKIIRAAKILFIDVINQLKIIAPVDVTIISGNHDTATMFMLGEVLDAWYYNDSYVTVNNSPKSRKYYQYGLCGFQYVHGEKEKHSELGSIFAHEEKQLWAATEFRFCKVGHRHISKKMNFVTIDSFVGFQVQIIPSLSGTDEWHFSNGYLSNKQGKAFLYHKTKGEIGEFTYTV